MFRYEEEDVFLNGAFEQMWLLLVMVSLSV